MHVRVCGPNLRNQKKGTFHVHRNDCNDLNYYGPGRREGGNILGTREMLVMNATVLKVVDETYCDQIDEQPEDEKHDYLEELVKDFWFAPCCDRHVPHGNNTYKTS